MKQLIIPNYIQEKIKQIVNCNDTIERNIRAINGWKTHIDSEISPENWSWDMYFTGSQDEITEENITERLRDGWASYQKKLMKEKMTKKSKF